MSQNGTPITLDTLITVPDDYYPDAVWNILGCVWGLPFNLFILVVTVYGNITGRFKHAIIGMTASQMYATVGQTLLYGTYFVFRAHHIQVTVLACSIPRRILQLTMTPALMSILVISIDRYISIVRGYSLSKFGLTVLFALPFVYSHLIYNTLTFVFLTIGTSDMCGPCLKMPGWLSPYFEPVTPVVMAVAILLNIRILVFLFSYHRGRGSLQSFSDKELRDMKTAITGVLLQACIPTLLSMPQVVNLAMYNIDPALRIPQVLWKPINFLNYCTLFLNPMITIIFVKQIRLATWRFLRRGKIKGTTIIEFTVTPEKRMSRSSVNNLIAIK